MAIPSTSSTPRLAGIDAPERKQAYGLASRKHLASIVVGQQVTVEYQKRDRYGRIVGKVLLDGIDVYLEQVKTEFAWHYKKYQHEQSVEDQRLYAEAENQARNERPGITQAGNPTKCYSFCSCMLASPLLAIIKDANKFKDSDRRRPKT